MGKEISVDYKAVVLSTEGYLRGYIWALLQGLLRGMLGIKTIGHVNVKAEMDTFRQLGWEPT